MLLHNLFIFSSYETDIKFIVFCMYTHTLWAELDINICNREDNVMLCRFHLYAGMDHMKLKAIFVTDVLVFYFHFLVPASTQNSLLVRLEQKKLLTFCFSFLFCMGDVCAHCYI